MGVSVGRFKVNKGGLGLGVVGLGVMGLWDVGLGVMGRRCGARPHKNAAMGRLVQRSIVVLWGRGVGWECGAEL